MYVPEAETEIAFSEHSPWAWLPARWSFLRPHAVLKHTLDRLVLWATVFK